MSARWAMVGVVTGALCVGALGVLAQGLPEQLAKEGFDKGRGKLEDAVKERARQAACEATGTQGLACRPPPDPSPCVEKCINRYRDAVQGSVDQVAEDYASLCKVMGKLCPAFQENIGPRAGDTIGDFACHTGTPPECEDEPDPEPEPRPDPDAPGGGSGGNGGSGGSGGNGGNGGTGGTGGNCPNCGETRNDPLLRTFDGLQYPFQLAGEFVLAQTDDLVVQTRYEPMGASASFTSVLAVRYDAHVVTFKSGSTSVWIDNAVHDLDLQAPLLLTENLAVVLEGNKFAVLAGPHRIYVAISPRRLDAQIRPGASSQGKWTGLLGDYDGELGDLTTRAGKVVDVRDDEVRHKEFGNSWRLSQAESFLPYAAGQSTEGFTNVEFPAKVLQLSDLQQAEFQRLAALCRKHGVNDGAMLHGCIYDLFASGDESLVTSYAQSLPVIPARATADSGTKVAVQVPAEVFAGAELPVFCYGPSKGARLLSVRNAAGKIVGKTGVGAASPAPWIAPTAEGSYTIELSVGGSKASASFVVKPIQVTLEAPASVGGATPVEVTVKGAESALGYLALLPPKQPNLNKRLAMWRVHERLRFNAPAHAGTFELVYLIRGSDGDRILARRDLEVSEATASVKHPATVEAGAPVPLEITGPRGNGDTVALFAAKSQGKGELPVVVETVTVDTRELRAPVITGAYKLRYSADAVDGEAMLAESDLQVTAATASLDAPATVAGGQSFTVKIEGPRRAGDRITLMAPGEEATAKAIGSQPANKPSVTLVAPTKPGAYQLFYVLSGSGPLDKVIARRPIQVTPGAPDAPDAPDVARNAIPPTAAFTEQQLKELQRGANLRLQAPVGTGAESVTFTHPGSVVARSQFLVKLQVKGSAGLMDVIELYRVGGAEPVFQLPAIAVRLPLPAPAEPGDYELRYVAKHDKHASKVVGTSALKVTKGDEISIQGPATAVAGTSVEVTITGTLAMGSLVTITKAGVKAGEFRTEKYGTFGIGAVNPGRSTVRVAAPRTPGTYELRVEAFSPAHKGPKFEILVRKTIVITPK